MQRGSVGLYREKLRADLTVCDWAPHVVRHQLTVRPAAEEQTTNRFQYKLLFQSDGSTVSGTCRARCCESPLATSHHALGSFVAAVWGQMRSWHVLAF